MKLAASIPQEQFYRFANQLKSTNQQAVFLAAWLVFIESEQLLDPSKFADLTGGTQFVMIVGVWLCGAVYLCSVCILMTVCLTLHVISSRCC